MFALEIEGLAARSPGLKRLYVVLWLSKEKRPGDMKFDNKVDLCLMSTCGAFVENELGKRKKLDFEVCFCLVSESWRNKDDSAGMR